MLAITLCLLFCQEVEGDVDLRVPRAHRPLPFAIAYVNTDGRSIGVETNGTVLHFEELKDGKVTSRPIFIPNIPGRKTRTQTYTVARPVTEIKKGKDGKKAEVTRTVYEEQTKTILFGPGPISGQKPTFFLLTDCEFTDLNGNQFMAGDVKRRLKQKTPILVKTSRDMQIDPFYRAALNQKMLIVTLPMPKR